MSGKQVITIMLSGGYISRRANRRKGFEYALYNQHSELMRAISNSHFSTLSKLLKEKKGRFTFNLNLVRQMHGKALPKILYKQSKQKTRS